jgi:hypothetical protein
MRPILTRRRVMLARGLAVAADLLQWLALPAFVGGAPGVADGVLDVVVCIALIRLVGWHIAFLPTFVGELVPFVELVPTWTLAVFFATRHWDQTIAGDKALPESLPPGPQDRL